ncbi:menaquinone reductase molybdopterin-binding-like subunit QrcB [Thermodesulfobacteriota bacterium]
MKIGRRSFLSFIIGGAVGTHLTPLPWKLTDDSAIWTQMWPWTPVPPDGEVSYVNSACTLCPGGCGISVRKVADRAVKIEGLKGHPVNDGGLCILGLSGLQLLYGPTRIQTPLIRKGGNRQSKWERVSWDDAIKVVTDKLRTIRSAGKPHSVACIAGSSRGTVSRIIRRFLTAYGSPNFIRTPSIQDTYEATLHLTQGVQASAGFDIENADFVLSFGSGIIEGWGSPVHMFRVHSTLKDRQTEVVQIEPRLSNTAAKSDDWIPINPGTEGALALGLAHVIVKESLYSDFIKNYTFGFNDWNDNGTRRKGFKRLVLEEYSPETVASITGIDAAKIKELARKFAGASKPLAICGRGKGITPGSLSEFMAVHALNALAGNINKRGGIWSIPDLDYINWPEVRMDAVASAGMQQERIDGAGSNTYPFSRYLLNRLPEAINGGRGYPIKALFVAGANPIHSMPDSKSVKKAFNKIPFIVSFSSFMDETTEYADIILPNHIYLERYEDVPALAGLNNPVLSLAKPVVAPQFDTKHTGDVFILMAKVLGGNIGQAFPWKDYGACLEETLSHPWNTLVAEGFWSERDYTPPSWSTAFTTDSRKFEFFGSNTQNKDVKASPQYVAINIEGEKSDYPLVLIPYESMRLATGYIGDPPFLVKTIADDVLKGNDVFVEVNPETAKKYGLSDGQRAIIETPKGSAKVRVNHFDGIMPGVVAMPRGLGHIAYDKYLAGKGVNVNELIGPVEDPASGFDAAWGIRAKLSRA